MELPRTQSRRAFFNSPPIADLLAKHPKALSTDENQHIRLVQEIQKLQLELEYETKAFSYSSRMISYVAIIAIPLFVISAGVLLSRLHGGLLPSWILSFHLPSWLPAIVAFISGVISGLMVSLYSSFRRRSRELHFLEESFKSRIHDLEYIYEITPEH